MARQSTSHRADISPTKFRVILFSIILLIIGASAAGFTYGVQFIHEYAIAVSHKKADAEASNSTVASLESAQKKLQENAATIKKVAKLKSDSEYPEIKIIDVMRAVAKRNNITITSVSEASADAGPSSAPATSTPPSTQQPDSSATTGTGQQTVAVSLSIQSPVNYRDYLQFLYDIEQNIPVLRIDGVGISPGISDNTFATESITVKMYVSRSL